MLPISPSELDCQQAHVTETTHTTRAERKKTNLRRWAKRPLRRGSYDWSAEAMDGEDFVDSFDVIARMGVFGVDGMVGDTPDIVLVAVNVVVNV